MIAGSFYSGIFCACQRNDQPPGCFLEGARQGLRESHTQYRRRELKAKPKFAPGLYDLNDDDDDDNNTLFLSPGASVITGVRAEGRQQVLPFGGQARNGRLLPQAFLGASLRTPCHLRSYFSLGRGLDPFWPWFEGGGEGP